MIEIENVNVLRIAIAKFLANFPEKAINLHSHAAIQVLSGELSEHLSSEFTPDDSEQLQFDFDGE
tara:strand:- start:9 stop:203 length:195 start_codon:yes stop_codon:yes gene_type:complete